ncbi:GTP pyrophosphokinase [Pectobacterium brasiliense]|uniref:GTP pyrophosphokinase n=1 Tax=Pectobacterium brasiliense TaxID=180957 RepID=UPI003987CB9B
MMAENGRDLVNEFIVKEADYLQFGTAMNTLISRLITIGGINTHSVHFRVKEKNSLGDKIELKNKYQSLDEITDIVGVRIITYYSTDIEEVEKLIRNHFLVDEENTIDKRKTYEPDRFGYMSLHYVVSLNEARGNLAEYTNFVGIKFEIQIRTILQHTWAEIEHDLGYKNKNSIPNHIKRKFSILSGSLELIDSAFIDIRKSLESYSIEAKEDVESTSTLLQESSNDINDIYMKKFIINSSTFDEMYKKYLEKDSSNHSTEEELSYLFPEKCKSEGDVDYNKMIRFLGLLGIITTDDLKVFISEVSKNERIINSVLRFKEKHHNKLLSRYFFLLFTIYCHAYIKDKKDIYNARAGRFIKEIGEIYDSL